MDSFNQTAWDERNKKSHEEFLANSERSRSELDRKTFIIAGCIIGSFILIVAVLCLIQRRYWKRMYSAWSIRGGRAVVPGPAVAPIAPYQPAGVVYPPMMGTYVPAYPGQQNAPAYPPPHQAFNNAPSVQPPIVSY